MENKIDKKKMIINGLINVLKTEFFGMFVFLFFWALSKAMGVAANIIIGLVGLSMVFALMADSCQKMGDSARKKVSLHGAQPCRNFGLTIGLIATIPSYITLVILALSKAGIIGNFLPAYKLLNAVFFPLIDLVAGTANIAEMNPLAFIMFLILPLTFILPAWISFRWGYDQIDLKTKVMFKGK